MPLTNLNFLVAEDSEAPRYTRTPVPIYYLHKV